MTEIEEYQEVGRALDNWARWSRASNSNIGYPKKAIMLNGGGGYKTTDDFCAEVDRHAAEVMDALIHDLITYHRQAVYNRWLDCKYVLREYEHLLMQAYDVLESGMRRRGLF